MAPTPKRRRKILVESTLRPVLLNWQTKSRTIKVLSAGVIFSANLRDASELKDYFIGPVGGDQRWLEVTPDTELSDFIWWDVPNKGRLPNMPPKEPLPRPKPAKTEEPRTRQVVGTHGTYTVTTWDGVQSCTCPGFTYRKRCRHLEM